MTVLLPAAVPDWLAQRAATTPDRAALVAGGRAWTFAELDAEATRSSRRLAALGVLVHAVLRTGATLVPLNVRLRPAELAWQLGDAAPQAIVVDGRTAALLDAARRERAASGGAPTVVSLDGPGAEMVRGTRLDAVDEAEASPLLAHDPGAVLAILYTSGTTGRPKGAMLTVGNFWWSAIGSALNLGTHVGDRWLACLPLFHVGGLSILLRAAIYGITAVVHDGFDAAAVNRAVEDEGVTIVSVVGVMLQRMLDERGDRPYPPSLRCVLLGGGPAPRPLLERCARAGVPVVQTYGLTETTSQVATLAPEDALRRLGSAGRPLYPNELRIMAGDGREARPGEAGEILVRGPVVMAGYAGRPDDTARVLVDGWLHTGDVGHLAADGYLHVLDRRDDLIVTGGENVYPAEVEAVLLAHPSVTEAAVIGLPDDVWGQCVVAVVRLAEGADPSDSTIVALHAHCREHLAGFKVPRDVRVVAEPLPRTASGKLRRADVRRLAAAAPPP